MGGQYPIGITQIVHQLSYISDQLAQVSKEVMDVRERRPAMPSTLNINLNVNGNGSLFVSSLALHPSHNLQMQ